MPLREASSAGCSTIWVMATVFTAAGAVSAVFCCADGEQALSKAAAASVDKVRRMGFSCFFVCIDERGIIMKKERFVRVVKFFTDAGIRIKILDFYSEIAFNQNFCAKRNIKS
jgi:predicted peroxiredoxin